MLTVTDLSQNKTVSANFNILCEEQKGHNTGLKGHFRDKRDKTRSFWTKGQKGHLSGSVFASSVYCCNFNGRAVPRVSPLEYANLKIKRDLPVSLIVILPSYRMLRDYMRQHAHASITF